MTKLVRGRITPPPLPSPLVSRPRLTDLFTRLINRHRVVCVYATAGAGKTTAVLDAAMALGRPLSWLTVDTTDVATGRLLSYLEAALARTVPSVEGVVTEALGAKLAHAEVAGLLAEALDDTPLLLVIDDLERLGGGREAMAILSAFLRYVPPAVRTVLISRSDLTLDLGSSAAFLAAVGESDLALTVEEAARALEAAGREDIDAATAVEMTDGWVAGVLFEAWRSTDHVAGMGGETNALHGYLSSQIIDQLPEEDREFLTTTALLDRVTAWRAETLGVQDASARLESLRSRHLPVSWDREQREMRYQSCFRDFLIDRLQRRSSEELRELRLAHGRLLAAEGHLEDAVEEFLKAPALDEAVSAAAGTFERVIDRADFGVAQRWLETLEPVRLRHAAELATPELMLAVAREDYQRGMEIADRLEEAGERDALARSSSRAAGIMSWCYLHTGRLAEVRHLLQMAKPGPPVDAMRYCMTLIDDDPVTVRFTNRLRGGPFDALVMRVHYYRGYWPLMMEEPSSPWAALAARPWRIGAHLAMGHTDEARELFDGISGADGGVWFSAILSVKMFRSLGQREEAWRALSEGRERMRASGTVMLEMQSYVEEAELALRLDDDPALALAALARVDDHPVGRDYRFIAEQADTWRGLALLKTGQDEAALEYLRRATDSALVGERVLCLPTAATYLAEAAWRAGDEEAADRAANVALQAATRQGTNHQLLEALSDFPAVLSRRLDAEPGGDSPWHALGRALRTRQREPGVPIRADVLLSEFGQLAITVDGVPVKPKIKKSYELLAFLAASPRQEAKKTQLLDALFEGRIDESSHAYLRQAVLKLRQVMPNAICVEARDSWVRLSDQVAVTSESVQFDALLAEAAHRHGEDRLGVLLRALKLVGNGDYLPGISSLWAETRRVYVAARATEARYEAAELSFDIGRYAEAERLLDTVVGDDPYREGAWRLLMKTADALGDHDQVTAMYLRCREALGEVRTEPSPTTQRLFEALRR